jgi:hypothetical protein
MLILELAFMAANAWALWRAMQEIKTLRADLDAARARIEAWAAVAQARAVKLWGGQ